jgi:hypothetical protein
MCGWVITCTAGTTTTTAGGGTSSSGGVDAGPEPVYDGDATDEAWRAMLDARASTSDDNSRGSTVTSPAEGAVLDANTPATFSWSTPLAAADPPWLPIQLGSNAYAHGDPVTGDIHFLFFRNANGDVLQVPTTEGTWTADTDRWTTLKAGATDGLTLDVVSAYMIQSRVSEGPYTVPGVRSFRID